MSLKFVVAVAVALFAVGPAAEAGESSVVLAPGDGLDRVQAACVMCHSLDYIVMNSVFLDRAGWEKTVTKMVKVMGAPLTPEDTAVIVAYLDAHYGKGAPTP